jgi:hypothetical protein
MRCRAQDRRVAQKGRNFRGELGFRRSASLQSTDPQESLGDGGDESWDGFGGRRHGWVVVGPRRGRDGRGTTGGGGAGGTAGRRKGAHGGPQMAGHGGRQREAADVRLDRRAADGGRETH